MRWVAIPLVLVGVLGAAIAAVAAASGWSIQHTPNPTSGKQSYPVDVSCTSQSACTAVGDYVLKNSTSYTMLAERWNGTKWSIQKTLRPTGAKNNTLGGVSCSSQSACTAVGGYAKGHTALPLAERWNGTKWSIQSTPNPTGGGGLNGVSCTSQSACTAVGSYGPGPRNHTLAERWNGTKWSIQKTPNPTGAVHNIFLDRVACASKSTCTAVGSYGKGTTYTMLAERWNGTKWSIQKTPRPTGARDSFLYGVACTSESSCTAVGLSDDSNFTTVTLAEHWNGTKWSIQSTPNPTGGGGLNGVSCTSQSACTAVGSYGPGPRIHTLAERWNGTKWSIQKTPNPTGATDSSLHGVACTSQSACTTVGYYSRTMARTYMTLAERWNGG